MTRRKPLTLFRGLAARISSSRACLWDSNTLKDELASNPKVLDFILGQSAHHGLARPLQNGRAGTPQ